MNFNTGASRSKANNLGRVWSSSETDTGIGLGFRITKNNAANIPAIAVYTIISVPKPDTK